MSRPWLTDGNIEFAIEYQDAMRAHFDQPTKITKQNSQAQKHRQALQSAVSEYRYLQQLNLTKPVPPRKTTKSSDGIRSDNSRFFEPGPFASVVAEERARSFGRAGRGAVTSVAEALHVINALAHPHQAEKIYYRGEHRYGYELKSRAQRAIEATSGRITVGSSITDQEINELRRFQKEVKADPSFRDEIIRSGGLPNEDDPEWLPIMQHYDAKFGTRLLDITSSIYAGLHFACIDWDGNVDFETDGLLYIFFGHGRYYKYERSNDFDDEISEFVPSHVKDAFKNWTLPEYMHHFRSKQHSRRELAQDGYFLVQGDIGLEPTFGGTAQFKICIPWWAKAKIIKELWFAGYTPERIIRGSKGLKAAEIAKAAVDHYQMSTPEWNVPHPKPDPVMMKKVLHYALLYRNEPKSPAAPLINLVGLLKHQLHLDANRISIITKRLDSIPQGTAKSENVEGWLSQIV